MKKIITTLVLTLLTLTTFSQKNGPLIGTVSMTQPTCYGYSNGEITINVSGGMPPYTYLWSDGDTTQTKSNLVAGNYSLLVTDVLGQAMGGVFTLPEPNQIIIEGLSTNTFSNTSDGTIDITNIYNTIGNYTWVWSSNNNQVMDQSSLDQSNLKSGNYKLYVTDENGCQGVAYFEVKGFIRPISVPGVILNGLSNNSSAIQLDYNNTTLYPNPSNGDITITSNEKIKQLKIINTNNGEEINVNSDNLNEINVNNLNTGNYIIYVIKDEVIETKKITVL